MDSLDSEACGKDTAGVSIPSCKYEFLCLLNSQSFVVDAADSDKFESAKKELHELLGKPTLASIPLLVLGNKNDLPGAIGVDEIIDKLYETCLYYANYCAGTSVLLKVVKYASILFLPRTKSTLI